MRFSKLDVLNLLFKRLGANSIPNSSHTRLPILTVTLNFRDTFPGFRDTTTSVAANKCDFQLPSSTPVKYPRVVPAKIPDISAHFRRITLFDHYIFHWVDLPARSLWERVFPFGGKVSSTDLFQGSLVIFNSICTAQGRGFSGEFRLRRYCVASFTYFIARKSGLWKINDGSSARPDLVKVYWNWQQCMIYQIHVMLLKYQERSYQFFIQI